MAAAVRSGDTTVEDDGGIIKTDGLEDIESSIDSRGSGEDDGNVPADIVVIGIMTAVEPEVWVLESIVGDGCEAFERGGGFEDEAEEEEITSGFPVLVIVAEDDTPSFCVDVATL